MKTTKKMTVKQLKALIVERLDEPQGDMSSPEPGQDPVAADIRHELTDMARKCEHLARVADQHAPLRVDPAQTSGWDRVYDAIKKAEAALDVARHEVYRLG